MKINIKTIIVSLALAMGLSITSAHAGPFKFRFSGVGSGSIGSSTTFTNAPVNLDVNGTTGSILIEGFGGGSLDEEVTVSDNSPGPITMETLTGEILSLDGPTDESGDVSGFVDVPTSGGSVTLTSFEKVTFSVPEPSALVLLLSFPAALSLRRRTRL
ncbi:MAG: hypothetical protein EXR36_08970 [Betaproteobacteria bacterium]|nr:hypothetical protein [Betaproteobacteria bacterium]